MCHNSLSGPCPHLVRWLMGISIIGSPITTLLTYPPRILPLLTSHPEIPPGPNRSVWNKCQTQFGSGVNTRKHGWHTECDSSCDVAEVPALLFYRCFPAVVIRHSAFAVTRWWAFVDRGRLRTSIVACREDCALAASNVIRIHECEAEYKYADGIWAGKFKIKFTRKDKTD